MSKCLLYVCSNIALNGISRARSTSGPIRVTLGYGSRLSAIQSPALLDVPRMCGNSSIRYAQKTLVNDFSHLKAIEVLLLHLPSRIRINAFWIFFAPTAPKNVTFTSAAMKKKFHPAA